jgi:hypothetical protein
VDQSLDTPASHLLVDQLTTTLSRRIEAGEANKEGLVHLLPTFNRRTKVSRSIFASAKQFLTHSLDEFEDFENVARFVQEVPGAIDEDELDRIGEEFKRFCSAYTDDLERDPEVLRSIAEEITTVGRKLGVDVSGWADPLFQQADEIEAERESDDPEPDGEDRSWPDDSEALRDVDQMFEGLLREINEKAS